jgi:uncharacterized protein YgbK (DUF1537 family)
MTANLPTIFQTLKSFNAPIVHYKTCSTFDSAPHIGSIGRAMEIGIDIFHPRFAPIVVAAPHLGRQVLFGKLFATASGEVYRIDQHPTMSCHPVTPMLEPDLRKHLAQQTTLPIALLDIRNLTVSALDEVLSTNPAAILFDGLDDASLEATGKLLWQQAQKQPLFAVGSSGLTQSLMAAWPEPKPSTPTPSNLTSQQILSDQLLILSGSCSPITQTQIEWALANGFHGIPIDPIDLINDSASALDQTLEALAAGRNPILYTSLGPLESTTQPHNKDLGEALGKLLQQIITRSTIRRTMICGGDTSSHAIQQLPVTALTWLAPVAPGAPLCRAHSPDPMFQDAEFILKGGQVGPPNFFEMARHA